MARKFLTSIDFSKNEIQNAVMQNLGADPGTPAEGQMWWRSDTNMFNVYDGAAVQRLNNDTAAEILTKLLTVDGAGSGLDADLLDGSNGATYLARANHTGTQLASTVSDFDTQVRLSRLDQMAAPTAAVSMNSQLLSNLAAPVSGGDAANKTYVDNLSAGLDPHASVRAATTVNGALATAYENGDVIDGVTLATGNRILIKDQTVQTENGIYTVNASGAPTRATDADVGTELTGGSFTFVEEGTVNADTGWVASHDGTPTIGSTNITFTQFSSSASITAGGGLTKTGNTLDVVGTANRIIVNADSIDIDANYVGQTSITTLGTIATGTWSATTIALNKGGTGATTAPAARTALGAVGKYSATIGDGAATSITITQATHGLAADGTNIAMVYDATSGAQVYPDVIVVPGTGNVTFTFAVAPTAAQYRVVIMG